MASTSGVDDGCDMVSVCIGIVSVQLVGAGVVASEEGLLETVVGTAEKAGGWEVSFGKEVLEIRWGLIMCGTT